MPLKLDLKTGEKNGRQWLGSRERRPERKNLGAQYGFHPAGERNPVSRRSTHARIARLFCPSMRLHVSRKAVRIICVLSDPCWPIIWPACCSANDVGEEITTFVDASDYYKALRASRKLIAHEVRTLDAFNSDMTKLSEIAAGAGDDDEDDQISSIQDEKELLNDT